MPNNDKNEDRGPLNYLHRWGIAKRLEEKVEDLPLLFDKMRSPYIGMYGLEKGDFLSPNSANKILHNHKFNNPVTNDIIKIVNAVMAKKPMPTWVKPIDLNWFIDQAPDSKWREHLPDYALWQDIVKRESQDKASEYTCGLYFLYRVNAMDATQEKIGGVERELLCIHQPKNGHIRVHLVNADNQINSGLGYMEERVFTVTLYRISQRTKIRTRFLMIDGPDANTPNHRTALIARKVGKSQTPYASAAILVRVDHRDDIPTKRIEEALYGSRLSEALEIDVEKDAIFNKVRPQSQIPWDSPELINYEEGYLRALGKTVWITATMHLRILFRQ